MPRIHLYFPVLTPKDLMQYEGALLDAVECATRDACPGKGVRACLPLPVVTLTAATRNLRWRLPMQSGVYQVYADELFAVARQHFPAGAYPAPSMFDA